MDITEMIGLVRKDLHDGDSSQYRWEDAVLTRHINHAVKDFSRVLPVEIKEALATVDDSRDIDLSGLATYTSLVMVQAVEFPVDRFPTVFQPFTRWGDILTLQGDDEPDGSNCNIYYGILHTLDSAGSTIPSQYEDLIVTGSCGYAATDMSSYSINRVNVGGAETMEEFIRWGNQKLELFLNELKRIGIRNKAKNRPRYEG